jgi:hypothetical protein
MLGRGGGLHGDEWTTITLPAHAVSGGGRGFGHGAQYIGSSFPDATRPRSCKPG